MTAGAALLVMHEALCLVVLWSVFCRAVQSTSRVRVAVRASFVALGLVASAGLVAPLAWGLQPGWFSMALLAAIALVQIVTAHYWRNGVPARFYRPD